MPDLSMNAWIALLCLGAIILSSGLVLWTAWRQRGKSGQKMTRAEGGPSFTRSWKKEDAQLQELEKRVRNLTSDKKDST